MTNQIVIIGAGETANLAYEYFTHDSDYTVVAFAVDSAYLTDTTYLGLPVVAIESLVESYPPSQYQAFVAIGSGELNYQRKRKYLQIKEMGYTLVSYISSRAFVWHNVKIGENCFIMEDNTLQPFTGW